MNAPLSGLVLLAAATVAGGAAFAPAGPQPPDRHQSVAGWQIEDVADGEDYDPMRRAIRLRREGPDWQIEYAFVEGALSVEPSRNAHVTVGFCNEQYGNSEREGSPATRARAARARLLALIAATQRGCQRPNDATAAALAAAATAGLAGFEQAFAAADAWDRERIGALAPFRAAAEAAEEAARAAEDRNAADARGETDADMDMQTNMTSVVNDAAPQ